MGNEFYLKNFFYSLFFYSMSFFIAGWNLDLTSLDLFVFIFVSLFGSLMYPFSLLFIDEYAKFLIKTTFNFVNWGFIICILLSLPPFGFVFPIYYFIKNKRKNKM